MYAALLCRPFLRHGSARTRELVHGLAMFRLLRGAALVPARVVLAHGAAGALDEVFNIISVGIILVILGIVVFGRKRKE